MSEEAWDNDFVGDSETNAATPDNSILDEPDDDKVDEVPFKDGDAEVQTENISETQQGSTHLAIDINVSATSPIENDNSILDEPDDDKVDEVPFEDGDAEVPTENKNSILEEPDDDKVDEVQFKDGDVEVPTENKAKNTFGDRWIQPHLVGDNSTLVREQESYKKQLQEAERKIRKVPTILHKVKMCYDPMIVAIGPYHHSNVKLKQMETLKKQFTLQYAYRSGKSIQKLYEEMEKLLTEAKNYYADDIVKAFNDKEFEDMMFIDSCFVIQFMDSCVNANPNPKMDDIKTMYIETPVVMRDIMLLENQLPFNILTKLMSLSLRFESGEGEKMIENFIQQHIIKGPIGKEALERKTCFWFSKSKGTSQKRKEPIHLLELVQTKFVDDEEIRQRVTSQKPNSCCCSYRSVKDLKLTGIHFQRSKSRRFSDITCNSMYFYGRLKLPQIINGYGTDSLLLNLVAFETCAGTSSNFRVSAYVYFMDTLINHAEDVKELRSKGIIVNLLGSDDQVAKLFNEIHQNLLAHDGVFLKVRDSLDAFYRSYPRLLLTTCLFSLLQLLLFWV